MSTPLRVALVHYWLVNRRGGERILDELAEMFPQADVYTPILDRRLLGPALQAHPIFTSFLQNFPGARRYYKNLLLLFPLALSQFDLSAYDLVISQESGPAKGVLTRPRTCHICYCHTPMRYLWDMYHDYRARVPGGRIGRAAFSVLAHRLRQWDFATAAGVDYFASSSENGASRIRKYYGRTAEVIYPPVNVDSFALAKQIQDYYLVVSALVSYKRVDVAIRACNVLGRRLVIIGKGEETARLRKIAGPTIEFLGFQPDAIVRRHYQRCRALLFPGEEDIGLTPVEAQACGRPVIAYGRGGALETVLGLAVQRRPEAATGIFFESQAPEALVEAIRLFEAVENRFSPEFIRAQAERFRTERFRTEMKTFVDARMAEFRGRRSRADVGSVQSVAVARQRNWSQ